MQIHAPVGSVHYRPGNTTSLGLEGTADLLWHPTRYQHHSAKASLSSHQEQALAWETFSLLLLCVVGYSVSVM